MQVAHDEVLPISQTVPAGPGTLIRPPKRPNRLFRILLFAGLGLLGFIGLVVAAALMLTGGVKSAGNEFLAALTGPQPAAAWQSAGPELRNAMNEADFSGWAGSHGMQGATATWASTSRNDNEGVMQGTMTRRDGGTNPIVFHLHRNAAGTWQVIGLSLDPPKQGGGSR